MTDTYHGSKGPMLIADLPYPYLVNAHKKLIRYRVDDSRDAEIAAMAERIAVLDAEYAAETAVGQEPRAEVV